VLEGVIDKLIRRYKWKYMPIEYGCWSTLAQYYRRWKKVGVFKILVYHRVLTLEHLALSLSEKKNFKTPGRPENAPPPRYVKCDLDGLKLVLAGVHQIKDKDAVRELLLDTNARL
jgi:hypothetical protein